MKSCTACQHAVRDVDLFCRQCGQALGVRCVCGAACSDEDRFCGQCGLPVAGGAAAPQRTAPDAAPKGVSSPVGDMMADAERDRKHFRLGRSILGQDDIDTLFEEDEA
jgi:hypothetical protein